jgi:pimeloyl-ACP methyl ester carboxylesterase
MTASSVLLVPGSWHGAWAYDDVAARLGREGVLVTAIDLPSNNGSAGLADDAAAVRTALDEIGEPTVVVGHSYGGIAVSEGAAGSPDVVGLVYLCAFMLEPGESLLDVLQHQLPDWISLDEAAGSHIAQRTEEVLYADCDPAVAARAAGRLTRQSLAAITAPQTATAWQQVPSTYLVCDRDRAVPPPAQEAMAARAGTVRHAESSHSPFLSRPQDVAGIVLHALEE